MRSRNNEVRDRILEDALEIENDEARAAFLSEACAVDAELRAELERLLGLKPELSGRFLEERPNIEFPAARKEPGQFLGRYRIESEIGCGGAGRVYRAVDTKIERPVALKVLFATGDHKAEARFQRELRMLGAVSHENVVRLYDYGESGGERFLVMEFLEGEDLGSALQGGRLGSLDARLDLGRQIVTGLSHIHQAGIIHRDLKPSNVFLLRDGRGVKLMDFGIAHTVDLSATFARLTMTGLISGTPTHMAPELIQGHVVTVASDVYSLGVTLYELFTERQAWTGKSIQELFRRVTDEQLNLEPLRQAGVMGSMNGFLERCLSKDPARRPIDYAGEYRQALSGGNEWDSAMLALLTQRLTLYIGPIARILVDRAAKKTRSLEELKSVLSGEIPQAADRERFLASLRR